tara:strand:+ start:282 stop:773 length:492 start_codon:yes stop_codon:yes gene_type:complete
MNNITNKGKNELGNRYERLVVINSYANDKFGNKQWVVKCDCGNEKVVVGMNLRKGLTKSCGCIQKEWAANALTTMNTTHGKSYTKEYKTNNAIAYKLRKRKQMPTWANKEKIKEIYLNRPYGYEVDHIIPLNGKLVSGLHIETNLQYLTPSDNKTKTNKFNEG